MAPDSPRGDNGTSPSPATDRGASNGAQIQKSRTYLADGDPVDIGDLLRPLPIKGHSVHVIKSGGDTQEENPGDQRRPDWCYSERRGGGNRATATEARIMALPRNYYPCTCMWTIWSTETDETTSHCAAFQRRRGDRRI